MFPDTFSREDCINLLRGKRILMFGSSIFRATYKDIIWLLEKGTLIPDECLRSKNEDSFTGDRKLSNGTLNSSRKYVEIRQYHTECLLRFEFLTKLFTDGFIKTIMEQEAVPDYIIINSCLWDLTRWGHNGAEEFRKNVWKTFEFLRCKFPSCRIIWPNTVPPSPSMRKCFLSQNLMFLRQILPFHVIEANHFVANVAKNFNVDVIDLQYYMRHLIEFRAPDGVHWSPVGVRYITNLILTHISTCHFSTLPRSFSSDKFYDFDQVKENNVDVVQDKVRRIIRKYDSFKNKFPRKVFNLFKFRISKCFLREFKSQRKFVF